jgi:hypothetical protein
MLREEPVTVPISHRPSHMLIAIYWLPSNTKTITSIKSNAAFFVLIDDARLIFCNYFDGIYPIVLWQINFIFNFKKLCLTALNK